jgi:hypothetical protein
MEISRLEGVNAIERVVPAKSMTENVRYQQDSFHDLAGNSTGLLRRTCGLGAKYLP